MSGFRYNFAASYVAAGSGDDIKTDDNGQPVAGDSESFACDYQPQQTGTTVTFNNSRVNLSAKLFAPLETDIDFVLGSTISVNGCNFILIGIFPTRFNTELWVK